jgi:hypothetical protein
MTSITKFIIGLAGIATIGTLTYYLVVKENTVVSKEEPIVLKEKHITNPEHEIVATAKVIQDTSFDRIKKALNIDGEEFSATDVDGVYANSANDKILTIKEDVWNKMIRKAKIKFPNIAEDCSQKDKISSLTEYEFVGLLTYFADSENMSKTTAYSAVEIRNGKSKSYAAGDICCDCEGDPLVAQQVDAVIVK